MGGELLGTIGLVGILFLAYQLVAGILKVYESEVRPKIILGDPESAAKRKT